MKIIAERRATVTETRTTPEWIAELSDGEIFVFGSNLGGRHGAGAARTARWRFGAELGVGEGLTGQCYAFPTLDGNLAKLTMRELEASRDRLYLIAGLNPQLTFLLTRVGTGLAGYSEEEMSALFAEAPGNIVKPPGW
jgi:hypothetical protein